MSVCAFLLATAPLAGAATIVVPAGGDLQKALNDAQPGDVITLEPGATYVGNFVLPNKGAVNDYITVRSATPDASLPKPGVRMTPAYAALLPKIRSSNNMSAMRTATAANHWKLLFLEFQANVGGYGDILALGAGDSTQTQLSQVPYALVVDRVYVHGDPVMGQKRGISLNSKDTDIVNSYVSECKAIGQDSQAIGGFNGPGNYTIENNYLEGAAENFLLGGADPTIPGLVTTDVRFLRNHLRKPLSWRDPILATPAAVSARAVPGGGSLAAGSYSYKVVARAVAGQTNKAVSKPAAEVSATIAADTTGGVSITWTPVVGAAEYLVYGRQTGAQNVYWKTTNPYFTDNGTTGTAGTANSNGTKWSVKNIFELKNAQDVLVEGNLFENMWMADQPGFPIVFTPRNQGGTAPWVVVQRVNFQNNLIRHTAGGVNILGIDNVSPSQRTNHITIFNNLFDDMTASIWGTGSKAFQLGDGPAYVTIDHNTIITTTPTILAFYGGSPTAPTQIPHLVYTNNMSAHNAYGIFGSNFSSGLLSLNAYAPDADVRRNVFAGGNASKYPTDNFFPTLTWWQSQFVDYAAGDYHLKPESIYKNTGTDGKDLGPDIDVINANNRNVLSGDNSKRPGDSGVIITTVSPLENGVVGQSYSQTIGCTGADPACAWVVQDSTLPEGLTFDPALGLISGVPSQVQTGSITIEAYDPSWPTNTDSETFEVTVGAPELVISMPEPPEGQVGVEYRLTLTVEGAMASVTWSMVSGTLPPGLGLDAFSGVIAGTPSAWGHYEGSLRALDSFGTDRIATKSVSILVEPAALTIDVSPLKNATYDRPYTALLSATGGTGSTRWSVTPGTLTGVKVDASGMLSVTPTAPGTFVFTVTAQDDLYPQNTDTKPITLAVLAPDFSAAITPAVVSGRVGLPLPVSTPSASGNVGSVSWSIFSGTLPGGLTLDPATGTLLGLPMMFGQFAPVIKARDSYSPSRFVLLPLTFDVAPSQLVITTTTMPSGSVKQAYQETLAASGGTGLTKWTLTLASGELPPGLTLDANGVLSGTPTAVGTFNFTVGASDAGWPGNVAEPRPLSITVGAREVVLYAADATRVAGTWSLVADASAAGGARVWNPDAAAAKLTVALASPANYFELTFQAEAGVAYHLWMRGKADKNAWANDSVYVQFSGTVDANGAAINRIGTTGAAAVSIEEGTNFGLSGWGWTDNAYGGFGSPMYFQTSGLQTIRVQVREDGLSLDQIVLSADQYATSAPGATKNDTTTLAR